jgi:hypothetical protein
MINRRTLASVLLASACVIAAPPARADIPFWEKVENWLIGGDSTIEGTSRAADSIQKSDYPQAERIQVISEIDQLNDLLDRLLSSKVGMLDAMETYLDRASQTGSFSNANRQSLWDNVKPEVTRLVGLVKDVQTMLYNSTYLKLRIDPETRSGLNRVMAERQDLLGKTQSLPPPRTREELAALGKVIARHRDLRDRTEALQKSLFEARSRLTAI